MLVLSISCLLSVWSMRLLWLSLWLRLRLRLPTHPMHPHRRPLLLSVRNCLPKTRHPSTYPHPTWRHLHGQWHSRKSRTSRHLHPRHHTGSRSSPRKWRLTVLCEGIRA